MKVWNQRFENRENIPFLEEYNSSLRSDRVFYRQETAASKAYAKALFRAGILTSEELESSLRGLDDVLASIERGEPLDRFEDIHSAVEFMLTERIGEAGRKLHTGRSRNEQVVVMERLYLKEKIAVLLDLCVDVQKAVLEAAEKYRDVIMPGYTHLQQAQPVLFSHYILALFWQMERGKQRLRDGLERVDVCPLGVGALAGSSVALDRDFLKTELGFSAVSENSLDTVSDRSYILEILFACGLILLDLSRQMEDLIVFSSFEFGFVVPDDSISTSSSLMPQKKNPDIFELIRASCGSVFGCLFSLSIVVKGLPSAYNKDLQLDKGPLCEGVERTINSLKAAGFVLRRFHLDQETILRKMNPGLFATDLADYLTDKGVSFREAHGLTATLVRLADDKGTNLSGLTLEDFRNVSPLFGDDVRDVFRSERSIARKRTSGSTHPAAVQKQIEKAKALLDSGGR